MLKIITLASVFLLVGCSQEATPTAVSSEPDTTEVIAETNQEEEKEEAERLVAQAAEQDAREATLREQEQALVEKTLKQDLLVKLQDVFSTTEGGMTADVTYDPTDNVYMLIITDDDVLMDFVSIVEAEQPNATWYEVVDLMESISNMATDYTGDTETLVMLGNPFNREKILLGVVDGEVFFNVFD